MLGQKKALSLMNDNQMFDESQTTFKCLLFYELICFTDPWVMSLTADKTSGDCIVSIDE